MDDLGIPWKKSYLAIPNSSAYEVLDGFVGGLIIGLPQFTGVTLKIEKQTSCSSMFQFDFYIILPLAPSMILAINGPPKSGKLSPTSIS